MSESITPETSSLTGRTVRAGTAAAILMAADNLIVLVRTLALSRLLSPREFGLMGMAFVAITSAEILSQTGFHRALVQRRNDPEPYLDTVWCLSVLRGLALMAVIYFLAPVIGGFFNSTEVVPILRTLSFITLLLGLTSPRWFLLEREMKQVQSYLPRIIGISVDVVVTVALALQWRSVWSIVFGVLAGAAANVISTFAVAPYRPRLSVKLARARELYHFGKHIFRHELLSVFSEQADRLAVGKLRDVRSLGLYTFASRLVTIPTVAITGLIFRVVFPAFAQVQSEPERVRPAFVRALGATALLSFPVATGMLATAREMVPVLFGEKWTPMTVAFQLLCLTCAARVIEQTCGVIGGGIGRPDLAVRAGALKLALMVALIVPALLALDIEGAALATLAAAMISAFYLMRRVASLVGLVLSEYLAMVGVPAAACVVMTLVVSGIRLLAPTTTPALMLVCLIAAGAVTYVVSVCLIDRWTGSNTVASVLSVVNASYPARFGALARLARRDTP